jgi:hypothetical protein
MHFRRAAPALRRKIGHAIYKGRRSGGNDDLVEIGAGEGIRTLDPDLGKVVLYP